MKFEQAVNVPALRAQASFDYDDASHTVTTKGDLNSFDDDLLNGEAFYDGLGRTTETRRYENPTQYVATFTRYDALGRPSETSNPYRPTLGETPVWTITTYDALGRSASVTTPDGARAYVLYRGSRTLVTDQDDKQRIAETDAFGRLRDVWEVTAADSATENVSFPLPQGVDVPEVSAGYRTSYAYDVAGRLLKVAQGAQRRYFAYDSLGRMIRASSPEQNAPAALALPSNMLTPLSDNNNAWSLKYEYDAAGNPTKRTDARGAITEYSYDALNRVQSIVYSGQAVATPSITYTYDDPSVPFSKGRLTSVGNGVSVYNYTAYDELGRVKASAQTTCGVTYSMPDYRYNLTGALVSEQYPSGRVVKTEYDGAGRVAGVKNQSTGLYYVGASPADAVNRIQYTAHGAVSALRLGNGLWEHAAFNTRLQPTQLGLGISAANSSVLRIDYTYGTTNNNGNVRTQTITAPSASPYVQTYGYDALNRLEAAEETSEGPSGTTTNWKQVYSYDRYGNRKLSAATTLPSQLDDVVNPPISQTTNRITAAGYSYDAAGSLQCDPSRPCAQSTFAPYYNYDGEGRMVSAGDASYTYDGDGRRVKKVVNNGEATVFVYDCLGRLVAEYSNQQGGGTSYLTQDSLGSTRVVTGQSVAQNQVVKERHDYLPFGEELYVARAGYGGGVRQKFTGYERDGETNLDFAQARYYSGPLGRFTSADPLLASGTVGQPQSWNRYAYSLNNPLGLNDPTGKSPQNPAQRGGEGIRPPASEAQGTFPEGDDEIVRILADPNKRDNWESKMGYWLGSRTSEFSWREGPHTTTVWLGPNGEIGYRFTGEPGIDMMRGQAFDIAFGQATGGLISQGARAVFGRLFATGAAEATGEGSTGLFRAVRPAELNSIEAGGGAFTNPAGIEVKYFSTTAEGAASYARQTFGTGLYEGPYTIVGTKIPSNMINSTMRVTVDRGIQTVVIPTEALPALNPARIFRFTPLPPR